MTLHLEPYVVFDENLFLNYIGVFKTAQFDFRNLRILKVFAEYDFLRVKPEWIIYSSKHRKLIEEVIDKYILPFDFIDTEEEALELANASENNYYFKKLETHGTTLSLNPILVQSLESAYNYLKQF
jgi:hypothetical protein